MNNKQSLFRGLTAAAAALLILLAGCSGTAGNVDIDPPTRGVLHYLQQQGMANVSDNGYQVQVKSIAEDRPLASGTDTALMLQVLDRASMPVKQFTEDMTKLMHLIVVSRDLSSFQHLHPDYAGSGQFEVAMRFPFGGDYLLIEEFVPDDKPVTVVKQWVKVAGEQPPAAELALGGTLRQTIGGLTVTLSMMPDAQSLKAGQMVMLDYNISDAATGESVQLEPYLGTKGHCVILDAKANQYVHVHAADDMRQGSNVMFHTEFPAAGTYRVWGQFQYNGQVIAAPFDVKVN
ncbi:hypothetical protein [Paenibacillus kobensis]|uniref:hypothetical protein n=1 Tax=Paenibacillus kobensis TaxID=59841 RepID=UPI000FDCD114|nr:hypothetical protein [Paenibacillus kobensis]